MSEHRVSVILIGAGAGVVPYGAFCFVSYIQRLENS
jgi:hypothetical protein